MRIWHQGMNATNRVEGLREKMEDFARLVADPGTEVDFFGLGAGRGEADRMAGVAVNYLYLHRLQVDQVIRNAEQAQAEGYDAFICASIDDPGLREVRSMVDIPVVGYGQTAMHVASMLASRVAIIGFLPNVVPLIEENIAQYGLTSKFAGVVYLDVKYPELGGALTSDPSRFRRAAEEAGQRAVELGADIVIPGPAPINEALFYNDITHIAGIPVLNTRALAIKFTEMLVRLKQLVGFDRCRSGYFAAKPPAELLQIGRSLYAGDGEPPRGPTPG